MLTDKSRKFYAYTGYSMLPTLEEKWVLGIEYYRDTNEIRLGDIVIFHDGIIKCHRVMGRHKRKGKLFFILKGDSRQNLYRKFPSDVILGKVVNVIDDKGATVDRHLWDKNNKAPFYAVFNFFHNILIFIKAKLPVRPKI